jgi:hypothetical protein
MAFLPAVIVMVALVPILSLLAGLIALRLVFAFVIPVLRPVSWTGALSRSWTLVRRRWWRVFGTTMALAFPAFALGLLGSRLATTLPVQAISELMAMLLGVFAGSGMTLLFLRLDSLGPVAARRAHEPAHDSTVATA